MISRLEKTHINSETFAISLRKPWARVYLNSPFLKLIREMQYNLDHTIYIHVASYSVTLCWNRTPKCIQFACASALGRVMVFYLSVGHCWPINRHTHTHSHIIVSLPAQYMVALLGMAPHRPWRESSHSRHISIVISGVCWLFDGEITTIRSSVIALLTYRYDTHWRTFCTWGADAVIAIKHTCPTTRALARWSKQKKTRIRFTPEVQNSI